MPIREGLARLEGVESVSRHPRTDEATCELRSRGAALLDPRGLKEQLAGLRVGARLRGVEATVDGFLERSDGGFTLRISGVEKALRLKPLERKVQLDVRRGRPQAPTRDERNAFKHLSAAPGKRSTAVRVVGPLLADQRGGLVLQVRDYHFFSQARPTAHTATLGIDVSGPYGLGEPWLALHAALQRLPAVESVPEQPDLRSATARVRLRNGFVPDLNDFAAAVRNGGVGASLRGVELTLDGSLLESGHHLSLQTTAGAVPLAPLTALVTRDNASPADPFPTSAEASAFKTLRAEQRGKSKPVRITGRCIQMPDTRDWLLEVRRYAWHPVSNGDDLEATAPKRVQADTTPDRDPPSPPANLTAAFANGIIRLEWDENTEPDLYDYVVYRSTAPGGEFIQLTAGVSTNGYALRATEDGVTHRFVVTAQDTSGNRSAYSNAAPVALPRKRGH